MDFDTSNSANPRMRTGGEALVEQLIAEGVTKVFGIPGIQLDWAVEALRANADHIDFVVPRHEQAASYMADGYARTTGREGVCMVVPGPGMLNALSGIATAYACSSRVLFLVGQIDSGAIGKGHGLLHELPDQSAILRGLCKWHALAERPEDVARLVHEAFVQLRSGHPRPVAIELPADVLQAVAASMTYPRAPEAPTAPGSDVIEQAATLLASARFPVIQAGGGAAAAGASEAIRALAERLQAPVVMTEGGRGVLDDRHPLALTTLGGRAVMPHADVVLVLGSRFVNALGQASYAHEATRYIYVNLDGSHAEAPRSEGLAIAADVRLTAEALLAALPEQKRQSAAGRIAPVKRWAAGQLQRIQPQWSFAQALRAGMADNDILVSELTQIGYYSTIGFPVHGPRRYVTPGYQGTLGYGFNTALGAAHGNPDSRVVSINGDGGFAWGMQELATAARDQCAISIVVFVDGHYGNVRRIQNATFGKEFAVELTNPDFALLARAYGIPECNTDSPEGLLNGLEAAQKRGGPALITVTVGAMPSPWGLIHDFVPIGFEVPANPLGEPETV